MNTPVDRWIEAIAETLALDVLPALEFGMFHLTVHSFCIKTDTASRGRPTPSPTCLAGQGGSGNGMRPIGNETDTREISLPLVRRGIGLSKALRFLPNRNAPRRSPTRDPSEEE